MNATPILTEADTCRELVTPKLLAAGWGEAPHGIGEQRTFTNGRLIVTGGRVRRGRQRRADYLLYVRRDFPLAVVESKGIGQPAESGVQQARDYAEMLGLKFAYATNGRRIIEIDYIQGTEREVERFATPAELWQRLQTAITLPEAAAPHLLEPFNLVSGKVPRYYQQIAIHRVIEAILLGRTRAYWPRWPPARARPAWPSRSAGSPVEQPLEPHRRIPPSQDPVPGRSQHPGRRSHGQDVRPLRRRPPQDRRRRCQPGREMYFGHLPGAVDDGRRRLPPVPADFFDLIIIDECHRGSSRDDSRWRAVLDYFAPAVQFGMTATPLREESRDSYAYFGNPVYTYSLRQGIEDGFLAPYRVHRVITTVDAAGWRPSKDELDRYGRPVPDEEYQTKDFERVMALRARTQAIAKHLTDFLKGTDRFAKTLVFCVDQEHAAEMRQELLNLNSDLVRAISRLRLPRHRRRGRHRPDASGALPGRRQAHARDPDHLATADHRRRCRDGQERGAGAGGGLTLGVQADHRTRHAPEGRLRQGILQHHRLHRHRHPSLRRSGLRWRSGADRGSDDRRRRRHAGPGGRNAGERRGAGDGVPERPVGGAGRDPHRATRGTPQVLCRRRRSRGDRPSGL
jgi:type I restriction enzyme, R subunit